MTQCHDDLEGVKLMHQQPRAPRLDTIKSTKTT